MDACLSYHPAIQGAQFAPRRIARKPRTSFAHHSEATALQLLKVDDLRLVDGQLGTYPATPEPGTQERLRVPSTAAEYLLWFKNPRFVLASLPALVDRTSHKPPDSSSQRENLISLFGPNLFHSLGTMVRCEY